MIIVCIWICFVLLVFIFKHFISILILYAAYTCKIIIFNYFITITKKKTQKKTQNYKKIKNNKKKTNAH